MDVKLDVAIATYRPEGIKRVAAMQLPAVEGVRYVVSWQGHQGAPIPGELMRSDIKIARSGSKGLAANRNNAFSHSSAPIVLVADDDLSYTHRQLLAVISTMEQHPEVDVATFQHNSRNKHYPEKEAPITRNIPKGLTFTSFEIAVRQRCLSKLRFDERFGLNGTMFSLGEDDKLMLDAVRMGLNCRYFPITITTHRGRSTGFRPITDPKAAAGIGCIIYGQYPFSWPLRVPLKAYRLWKNGSGFWFCLGNMLRGVIKGFAIMK